MKKVLTIAGSDCSGGAGIQADLKTMSAHGVFGMSVIVSVVAENTARVLGIQDVSPDMIRQQMVAVFQDIFPDAVKVGMLSQPPCMEAVAEKLREYRPQNVVIDPVMGDHGRPYRTYTPELCRGIRDLSRLADVVVPNRTEAAILLERDYGEITLEREEDCCRWARALSMGGRRSVVLTGIALEGDRTGAACFDRATGHTEIVTAPHVAGDFHGTGDLFASVLTGALVRGMDLMDAAALAAEFTALCARRTAGQNYPRREGVDFEPLLWRLGQALAEGERAAEEPRRDMGSAGPEPGKGEPL